MRTDQPHAAVWLDISGSCQPRARFTADFNIEVTFGKPDDEMHMIFERSALSRLVAIVSELLAAAEPDGRKVALPEIKDLESAP